MAWATVEQAVTPGVWADAAVMDVALVAQLLDTAMPALIAYATPGVLTPRTVAMDTVAAGYVLTAPAGTFGPFDYGRTVTGPGIPDATTVLDVYDDAHALLSNAATATATAAPVKLEGTPQAYVRANILQARDIHQAAVRDTGDVIGIGDYAIRARPLTTAVKQLLRPQRPSWSVL